MKYRRMITFPKAKLNFGLRVTGKRPDGYHNIETVFYPVPLCDALEFVVHPGSVADDHITVTGINIGTRHENNLVLKAVRRLREDFPIPYLNIHLHKAIPSGAGLGGGSSDAAYMIRALNRIFNLSLDNSSLKAYGLLIGSDCPFFIEPLPSVATGRGEILECIPPFLEGYYLMMINPGIAISTREAYLNTGISESGPEHGIRYNTPPSEWRDRVMNDFEDFAFRLHPEIRDLKNALYESGALFSSMSGSGSTVYGIFEKKPEIPEELGRYLIFEGLL